MKPVIAQDNTSIIPSRPYQKEFARLEVQGAFTSKRKLLRLVREAGLQPMTQPLVDVHSLSACSPCLLPLFC